MLFDLVDLRLLAAIEDTGSLSKAASTFPIALSAASNRLRKFEQRTNVSVFVRTPAGMTATPAGRIVLDYVRQILMKAVDLQNTFGNKDARAPVSVRIAGTTVINCVGLLSDISMFSAEFPTVGVELQELTSVGVVRALQAGDIEIGIVDGNNAETDLIRFPFKQDNLVLVVAPDHPLSSKNTVTFSDVLGYQFVSLPRGDHLQAYIEDMVAAHIKMIKIRVRAPTFPAVSQLVSQNTGVAIMPESAARFQLATCSMRIVSLREPWAIWNSWLCIHSWDQLSAHGRQLLCRLTQGATK